MIVETQAAIEARLLAYLKANTVLYDPTNPDPTKRGLTSPSQVAQYLNFLNVISTEFFMEQNLMSLFESEVEGIINGQAVGTPEWIQAQVFKFQYDATNPQIVALDTTTFTIDYPTIDLTKRIISRCAVVNAANGQVAVKVATGTPPDQLSSPQANALTSYLAQKIPAGIDVVLVNLKNDLFTLFANVIYDGQYSAIIQANVELALNNYLAALNFNSIVKVSDIENTILAVAGVKDVELTELAGRLYGVSFSARQIFYSLSGGINNLSYQTSSGYIVQDPTSGSTFADTITYTVG